METIAACTRSVGLRTVAGDPPWVTRTPQQFFASSFRRRLAQRMSVRLRVAHALLAELWPCNCTCRRWYAVRLGRIPGVYTSWAEAHRQVNRYPGAAHKKFRKASQAWAFVTCSGDGTAANHAANYAGALGKALGGHDVADDVISSVSSQSHQGEGLAGNVEDNDNDNASVDNAGGDNAVEHANVIPADASPRRCVALFSALDHGRTRLAVHR